MRIKSSLSLLRGLYRVPKDGEQVGAPELPSFGGEPSIWRPSVENVFLRTQTRSRRSFIVHRASRAVFGVLRRGRQWNTMRSSRTPSSIVDLASILAEHAPSPQQSYLHLPLTQVVGRDKTLLCLYVRTGLRSSTMSSQAHRRCGQFCGDAVLRACCRACNTPSGARGEGAERRNGPQAPNSYQSSQTGRRGHSRRLSLETFVFTLDRHHATRPFAKSAQEI